MENKSLENAIDKFRETGYPKYAQEMLRSLYDDKKLEDLVKYGLLFLQTYPTNLTLLFEFSKLLIMIEKYAECEVVLNRFNFFRNVSHSDLEIYNKLYTECKKHITKESYCNYNKDIVKAISERKPKDYKLVTFTITSCKRFDLFALMIYQVHPIELR